MNDSDYIYLSAKIRALEPKILDQVDIDRMINATDLGKAFQVLNDTDYSHNLLNVEPENYRDALLHSSQQFHEFLQKNIPDKNLFRLLVLKKEFTVIRLLVKEKFFGVDTEQLIKNNSIYHPNRPKDLLFENHINHADDLRYFIFEQKSGSIDNETKNIILEALKKINNKSRPDEIDSILTQSYYKLAQILAKQLQNKFISNYIKTSIDIDNLIIFIRARRLKINKDNLKLKLISGGNIDTQKIISAYPDDLVSLKNTVNANLCPAVSVAYNLFCENKKIFLLESALEDCRLNQISIVKTKAYGPEIVFAYYVKKTNADANVGIILAGKSNHVPIEEIKKSIKKL